MALRHLAAVALFTVCLIPLICSHPYATGSPQWAIQQGGYQYHTQGEIPPHDPYGTVGNLNFYPPPAPEGTEAHLDVIKDVEIGPTQVVIITSKEGSADKLRVKIEMMDLQENRKLPPTDLSGLWLLISRGRYTIPFLKPDRWYGLSFRSENIVNNQILSHTDTRLIRTLPRQGNGTAMNKMFEVKVHRTLEGVENLENLYMTARWQGHERPNSSELLIKVMVECNKSKTNEAIHLGSRDDSVTIEISMDHRYDLEEMNKTAHEYKAHITPVQCKRVCWKPSLQIHAEGIPYTHGFPEECKNIEATTAKTFLRYLKDYSVEENPTNSQMELVIHTEVGEPHEQAFVTLSALRLDQNDSEVVYRSFSTSQSDGIFRMPLDEDAVYAVTYEYTKTKPFHYSAKEHFVVESPADNLTRASHPPLVIQFEPDGFHDESKKLSAPPIISLNRGRAYDGRKVLVKMDPLCSHDTQQITLSDQHPHQEINATEVLCSLNTNYHFCDPSHNYTKCSPILCYSLSVLLDVTPFSTESRCLNVTQHFKLNDCSSTSGTLYFIVFMLLLMVR